MSIVHHDDKNKFESKLKRVYEKGDVNINNTFETDKLDDVRFLDQYKEEQHYEV